MISIPLETIQEAAKVRPAGYYEDVLEHGEIEGDNIKFDTEDYLALRRKYSGPSQEQVVNNEPICRACDWLSKESLKCMHPNCGCPLAPERVEPWLNLTRCPISLF